MIHCACGRHHWPAPRWWTFLRRLGFYRTAGWLYAKRFGFWAPGLIDIADASETLHALNPQCVVDWDST